MRLRRTSLTEGEVDLDPIRGDAAVSLVWSLSRECWSLSGSPVADYTRDRIPIRFVPWSEHT